MQVGDHYTLTNTNGKAEVVRVDKPNYYTFSDGTVAKINRVSPILLSHIRAQFPPPEPPYDEKVGEANYSHPDYLRQLEKYEADANLLIQETMFLLGIDVEVDTHRVTTLRNFMRQRSTPIELHADDKLVFITDILIQSPEEIKRLAEMIAGQSAPTERAIEAAQDMFPSSPQGAGREGSSPQIERSNV